LNDITDLTREHKLIPSLTD